MALVLADRVRETTTVTGTGTATLLGAAPGYQSFSAVGNANTTYYVIANQSASEWEVGIGTYTSSGTTLSRDTVLASSNGGSLVNFSAGTKDVFVDYPAGKAVYEDAAGNVDGYPITGGTINNTTIGATTPSTGVFTTLAATGQTSLGGVAGAESLRVLSVASSANYWEMQAATATNGPIVTTVGTDANIPMNFRVKGSGSYRFNTNNTLGTEQLRVAHTASAVNYVQVTGAATGSGATISAQGSDTNVGLAIRGKGSGFVSIGQDTTTQFAVSRTSSAVNYLLASGGATNFDPTLTTFGADTNISMALLSKGTGAIDLAAGSSGVNISNGGTVTAITRTNAGTFYTSIPTLTVSPPTTAGGVQATATPQMAGQTVTVQAAGTGYVVGNTLTVVGGTSSTAAQLRVDSINGSGGVTATSFVNTAGAYSVLPTNPVSVTGGAGSGATFNITQWFFASQGPIITNAGSGYVEQPTVTFSGGGGSGAAAYATVGSYATIKAIGFGSNKVTNQAITFETPNSITSGNPAFIIRDAASFDSWYQMGPSSTQAFLIAKGNANASAYLGANGSGSIRLTTNGDSIAEQMRVSHTASAVNYVQVTGAATGNSPAISAQGSDANVNLLLNPKGTGQLNVYINNGSQFRVSNIASAVNYLEAKGNIASNAPILSAQGSDTNIPLVLQPKGTGALQAQQTDSTATGGNARGANAVDWQTSRSTAAQVASQQFASILSGDNNTASAYSASVLGGRVNVASGIYSSIGGGYTNSVSGPYSGISNGSNNTAAGWYNYIGGGFTNSGTANGAVTTQSGTMNATTAVTLSGSNASIKVGQYITGTSIAGDTYVAAISGTSLTLSKVASGSSTSTLSFYTPHGVVVGGGNNQATGAYSAILGGGDAGTAANRNVASGAWSVVVGGIKNTAANGYSTVCGGNNNTVSGASTTYGFIGGGQSNTLTGFLAATVGGYGNVANSAYSQANGSGSNTRSVQGVFAYTAGNFSTNGDAQWAVYSIRKSTTDATPSVLTTDTGAGSNYNQVILPNNSAYYFRGEVISGVTGGGNTKGWFIEGVIKRGANAASTALVGTPTVTSLYADAGAATWTIAVTADTTNGGLAVTFTGQASTTIRTVAQIRTTEMTY